MKSLRTLLSLLFVGGSIGLPQQPTPACAAGTNCLASKALEPRFFKEYKSQRQSISYGPFTVPGTGENHGMKTFSSLIAPPCTDCYITHAQADLQYPNGTYANVNTGMWLHHVVISNLNRTGAVCSMYADYVFASGNERTPANICVNGTQKAGYFIAPGSIFHLGTELMNELPQARDAIVVIDWEFVPLSSSATTAAEFKHATPLWLDIDGACSLRGSEVPVPTDKKIFSMSMSPPWKATFAADTILWVMAHIHDGGENLVVTRNGVEVCDAVAGYGESEGYVSMVLHEHVAGAGGGHMGKRHTTRTPHVSSLSSCSPVGKEKVQVGDEWSVVANYNLEKYAATSEGDGLAPIMGISMVYVVKN
ncbi:hypothetical protein V8F20_010496 [Naviculisporaceae sp. PSN 640]